MATTGEGAQHQHQRGRAKDEEEGVEKGQERFVGSASTVHTRWSMFLGCELVCGWVCGWEGEGLTTLSLEAEQTIVSYSYQASYHVIEEKAVQVLRLNKPPYRILAMYTLLMHRAIHDKGVLPLHYRTCKSYVVLKLVVTAHGATVPLFFSSLCGLLF